MDTTLSDALTGRLLDGRYQVGPRLARGGMATVYRALDTRLERPVAIKVMQPGLAADPEFVSRFIREARSAARLSHPNIVAVYDQGTDGDTTFLAMEFVDGVTLRDVLRQRGALPPDDALQIMEQILAALAAAHRGGIIHRDIKPENVLLTTDGRVKVADFGLARAISGTSTVSTLTGSVIIGTVAYLSPELVERGVADARSDVYAAGIVLFEMLTGRKPYVGESPLQVAFRHVHEVVPAPSTLVPSLSSEVDTLVGRATARNPDDRPHDASELLDAVTRVREGRPLLLTPVTPVTPVEDGEATIRAERTLVVPRPSPDAPTPVDRSAQPWRPATARPATGSTAVSALAPAPVPDDAAPRAARRDARRTRVEPVEDSGLGLPVSARRSRRRGWITFVIVLVLGIALLLGTYWWAIGRYTDTPSVLHKTQAQAELILERAGLHPAVQTDFSESIAPGAVIDTRPGPSDRILDGSTVTLIVSKGPERFAVPNVVRMTVDAATKAIEEDLPLTVSPTITEEYSSSIAAGLVIHTMPPIGQPTAKRGGTVSLFVSKGPAPIAVPTVVGRPLAEAQATLTTSGFKETHDAEEYSDTVPKGSVISQTPHDTSEVPGTTVELVISKGPQLFAVPGVEGFTREAAEKAITDAGFKVSVKYPLGSAVLNNVYSQSPAGGSMQPHGTTIIIIVV